MSSLQDAIIEALDFFPEHRKRNKRTEFLNLDILFDEARKIQPISTNAFDFILMAYRYAHPFYTFADEFLDKKTIKPLLLLDLLHLTYSCLLTRDQIPHAVLVHEIVEVSKKKFGPHTSGLTNAFCRRVMDRRDELNKSILSKTEMLLGQDIPKQIQAMPQSKEWLHRLSSQIMQRQSSGIGAFDENLHWNPTVNIEAFSPTQKIQAMDLGSWLWVEYVLGKIDHQSKSKPIKILDVCAAPGGKLIAIAQSLIKQGFTVELWASDVNFQRLERLKENLQRWNFIKFSHVFLHDWASDEQKKESIPDDLDLIIADLPCSGLGTLHKRPDLLLEHFSERIPELCEKNKKIIKNIKPYKTSKNTIAVSVCTMATNEIRSVEKALLGQILDTPHFCSFEKTTEPCEGILGYTL